MSKQPIIGKTGMRLVHEATGEPVCLNETATNFRGEKAKVRGGEEPRHSGSSGRVYVAKGGFETEYYPGVYSMKWVQA